MNEEMAKTIFQAYTESAGGKTHDGRPIPDWEELGSAVRTHWAAAAAAALRQSRKSRTGRKIVYVSAPYTAANSWEREQNIRYAEDVALTLQIHGFAPICVHTQTRFWYGRVAEAEVMDTDFALLDISAAMVLAGDWEHSAGCTAEIIRAFEHEIPIYACLGDLLSDKEPMTPETWKEYAR